MKIGKILINIHKNNKLMEWMKLNKNLFQSFMREIDSVSIKYLSTQINNDTKLFNTRFNR